MKKIISIVLTLVMGVLFTACNASTNDISIISREAGSGTRGAFVELLGIVDENDNDIITDMAEITSTTSVMLTKVAEYKNAIGYVSLGSLSDDVKALKVDGAPATAAAIKNNEYKISRNFNLATKSGLNEVSQDFIDFILSNQGQEIVADKGYINIESATDYKSKGLSGVVKISGSTSVGPLVDALADGYKKLNSNVKIEIQQTGSSAGVEDAIKGVSDIGMVSRELKDSESSQGLNVTTIAIDGIAVIVNKENALDNISSENIKKIFMGEILSWDEISK